MAKIDYFDGRVKTSQVSESLQSNAHFDFVMISAMKLAIIAITILLLSSFQSHAVVNGTPLTEERILQSIVQIVSKNGEYCTGSVISPKIILTAGHCMDRTKPVFEPFIVNIFKNSTDTQKMVIGLVGISSLSNDIGKDYGMIFLSDSIQDKKDALLPFASNFSEKDDLCVVGQGLDEYNQFGKMKIRCGLSLVGTVPGNMAILSDKSDPMAGGAKGDSGGPVLKRNSDGTFEMVGIFTNGGVGLFGSTTNQGWFVPINSPEVKSWINQSRCSSINMQKFDDSCGQ